MQRLEVDIWYNLPAGVSGAFSRGARNKPVHVIIACLNPMI